MVSCPGWATGAGPGDRPTTRSASRRRFNEARRTRPTIFVVPVASDAVPSTHACARHADNANTTLVFRCFVVSVLLRRFVVSLLLPEKPAGFAGGFSSDPTGENAVPVFARSRKK
jgi:hypothetical protein